MISYTSKIKKKINSNIYGTDKVEWEKERIL